MLRRVITYCPRCGAEMPPDIAGEFSRTTVRCPDCRLAPGEAPPMLAPSDDEIGYEMDEWPVTDRGPVTAALMAAEIPYRWEAGLVLVVPTAAEEQVDQLIEGFAEDGASADEGEEDAVEQDGGEGAQAAMSDLYVAADRLQHAPYDDALGGEFVVAAALVADSLPPYGIERPVWRQIQEMAATVESGVLEDIPDDEKVGADTKALREFLRSYV